MKKEPKFNIDKLIELDGLERSARLETEQLQQTKNSLAKQAKGGITDEIRNQSIELGKQLKAKTVELEALESEKKALWLSCPNVPEANVPVGHKEENQIVKTVGQKPSFSFPVKNHLELNEQTKWFGAKKSSGTAPSTKYSMGGVSSVLQDGTLYKDFGGVFTESGFEFINHAITPWNKVKVCRMVCYRF